MFQPWKLQHTYYITCNQIANKSTITLFELNLHTKVCESNLIIKTYHNSIKFPYYLCLITFISFPRLMTKNRQTCLIKLKVTHQAEPN